MKKGLLIAAILLSAILSFQNCGGFRTAQTAAPVGAASVNTPAPVPSVFNYPGNLTRGFNGGLSGPNIIPVTVGSCGFATANSACVSVTICIPNTSECQTIPNIQLSTSDSGLRLFASAVTLQLPSVTSAGATLANCDTTTATPLWGPVASADIKLGGEPAVTTSVQLINSSFPGAPASCASAATTPSAWGANGTLGVGLGYYDCGPYCSADAGNGIYFSCTGSTCNSTAVDVHDQITNPVALLPVDNNGVALTLPSIAGNASSSPVSGSLILGIGTEANNTPESAVGLGTDDYGMIRAQMGGQTYNAFFEVLDNTNYFPNTQSLPACNQASAWSPYFCPTSEQSVSVTFTDDTGATSIPSFIAVGNAYNESSSGSGNVVWDDVGQVDSSTVVMGVDFFFGKTIYVGIVGVQSPIGMGPYYGF